MLEDRGFDRKSTHAFEVCAATFDWRWTLADMAVELEIEPDLNNPLKRRMRTSSTCIAILRAVEMRTIRYGRCLAH